MRIVFFLLIFISAITLPFYIALILGLVYAFRYFAPELLAVAFVIDVYFSTSVWPQAMFVTLGALLLIEWYKTYSSFYNTK